MNPLRTIGPRFLVVVLCFTALELGLRHLGDYGKWVVQERSARFGWRMLPNQNGWSRDYTIPETINARGFRDREWEPPALDALGAPVKRAGLLRVAVVGNSMTYGTGVRIEDTWPRVLERLLSEELRRRGDSRDVLVMSFAVQGYVFEQMAEVIEHDVLPFRPDLLIVPSIPHDVAPMPPSADDPDYVFRTLVIRTAIYDWLRAHVLNNPRILPSPGGPSPERIEWARIDASIKEKPLSRENFKYWELTFRRLEEIRALVEARGGRVVHVALPVIHKLLEADSPTTADIFEPFFRGVRRAEAEPAYLNVEPLPRFAEEMADLAEELRTAGFEFTERGQKLIDPNLAHAGESLFLLEDTGHFSARGHQVLAEVIAQAIAAADWL